MQQIERRLNLLSIFHLLLGALNCVLSLGFLMNAISEGQAENAGVIAAIGDYWIHLTIDLFLCVFFLVAGIFMLIASRRLRNYRSRVFCVLVAGIECVIIPFGTILGVLTLITISRDSAIRLFADGILQENNILQSGGSADLECIP